MSSGGLIDMASFLSFLKMLRIILTHHSLKLGHSQESNTTGVHAEKKTK